MKIERHGPCGQWRARCHGTTGIYGNPGIVESVTYRESCGFESRLEVGKLVDFAILSADPTAIDLQIERIQVVETIKNGRSIFRK